MITAYFLLIYYTDMTTLFRNLQRFFHYLNVAEMLINQCITLVYYNLIKYSLT